MRVLFTLSLSTVSKHLPPSLAENFPSSTYANPITWNIPPSGNYGFQNLKIFFRVVLFSILIEKF
jgi:hypothetical protein